MTKTILQLTPLSVRIPVDKKGYVVGSFSRPLYIKHLIEPLKDYFYNKSTKKWEQSKSFYWFNLDYYIMYFPRYMLDQVIMNIHEHGGSFEIHEIVPKDGKSVSAPMPGFKPKSDVQKRAIDFVLNEDIGPVRVVTLDPGLGKTVIAFKYTSATKKRVLIHSSINMKDWPSRIKNFVDIPDDKIYFMSGQASFDNLITNIDEIDPVFILTPTTTLRNYCKLREHELGGRPEPEDLLEYLGVHTRINDEAHLHIQTNVMLDMRLTCPVTIPLSATLESSSDTTNSILKQHYPNRIRFSGSLPNHVYIYDIVYTLNIKVKPFHFTQRGMYNHATLEGWSLKGGRYFLDKIIKRVYTPLLLEHYVNIRREGQKCLILVVTTDYAEKLKCSLEKEFSSLNVHTYFSSMEEKPNPNADIIITTLKSGGTGTDIKKLITVLNTVSIKSSPENKQNVGRLRTIDGVNPRYIFTTWSDVPTQKNYREDRLEIYKEKAKKLFKERIVAR